MQKNLIYVILYIVIASVVEWSITTDCKSVGLCPTKVRILPGAQIKNPSDFEGFLITL